ncbi:nuclear transport factor 2 isoform X2 [Cornus florida]|uniref:nuclear transport factor 2 isoform X2 n=1 Tax=Cornus florida TaxID=4283 RepID=UPI00289C94F0|nr:nuclear transport factor 2 isoform X2 [Cornus florida]
MASPFPSSVSAFQVGSYFVGQYYQIVQQQPDFAHQFYTDASTVVRVDGDSSETAATMLEIHTLITSLNFTGIEIKTINSLESWSGGVLVVVSGSVKIKDFSGRRKFVQTFLLAPQEKGYYVMNDIFHFLDEEAVNQHPAPVLSEDKLDTHLSTSTPLLDPPASDYALEVETRDYVNSVHIEGDDPDDEYSIQEQQQQQEPEDETVVEETSLEELPVLHQDAVNTMQDPLPAVEEPVGEPPKLTYASILRAPKKQYVPSVAAQPSFPRSTTPDSEWNYPPQPAPQQSNYDWSYVPESSSEAVEESLSQEGESKSVYVRNLPSSIAAADIELEFMNFGRIKPDGVFVRNRTEVGVCYAFVEFEDVQSVQNAIKASPIQLAGRQVYIEERRANSSSTSRGGRRGRGRGSYQSEAVKGRSGGRNLGRGRNQDGGDYYRPRGNGFRGS